MQRVIMFAATILLAPPIAELAAQAVDTPLRLEGRKVRLLTVIPIVGETKALRVTGTGMAQRDDSIRVVDDRGHLWSFSRSQVQRLEVSLGRSRWRGAAVGATVGTLLSFVVQSMGAGDCVHARYRTVCRNDARAQAVPGATLAGAVLGAVIGIEQWQTIARDRRLGVMPLPGRLGLRVAF